MAFYGGIRAFSAGRYTASFSADHGFYSELFRPVSFHYNTQLRQEAA
jgi:hypothetical protein